MKKTVLITGCSTGIGYACAARLAGSFRVIAGVRKPEDAERLRRDIGPGVTPILLDVTSAEQTADAVNYIERECGGELYALVNNAGYALSGAAELLPLEDFRRQFEVNIFGPLGLTQKLLPALRRGRGRLVMMGSSSAQIALPFAGAYSATKAALDSLTTALRAELAPEVKVVNIEPGAIETPIWSKVDDDYTKFFEKLSPEAAAQYRAKAEHMMNFVRHKVTQKALSPDTVAIAVETALTAATPRPRYIVGRAAKLQAASRRLLPETLIDKLLAKVVGS